MPDTVAPCLPPPLLLTTMPPPSLRIDASLLSLPVVTVEQVVSSANKVEQYLVNVINAEGWNGLGSAVSARFPERTRALGLLGHAVLQQVDPDARAPEPYDSSPNAVAASLMYTTVGTYFMERVPRIDQAAGPLAAAGVVLALYSHGPGSPRPDPVMTASALAFVNQAVRIQDRLDAGDAGNDLEREGGAG